MASYSYKQVTHRDDYLAAIALWQEQSGRESDEDPNYDGDCWLVTEFLLDQKDADLARVTAERDRLTLDLHSARQMVTDTHAALERSERLWQEDERLGRAREDALEARVTELEYLIADHEFEAEEYDALAGCRISICPVCGGHGGHHTHGLNQPCPWGQAAANHRAREAHAALGAREPVEGRDFERMPGVAND